MIDDVLNKIYAILVASPPTGTKRIFEPGKPVGPWAQNMPAILVLPGAEAERSEDVSDDVEVLTLNVEVHIYTEDVYTIQETRNRGKVGNIAAMIKQAMATLKANPDLDFLVDDLADIGKQAAGPAHWWIEASYTIQRGS